MRQRYNKVNASAGLGVFKWALPLAFLPALISTAYAFTWGAQVRITGLYVYAEGTAFISTDNNQNPDNCENPRYLAIDPDSKHFSQLYATAMAAYTSKSTVSINYSGCFGPHPKVNSIALPNIW